MTETLFESADATVRWRGGDRNANQCVVTFSSYSYVPDLDRPGFAEAFLYKAGIDAIHVVARDNRWYDMDGLGDMLGVVAARASKYGHVATYGSSMGGFAALHFAGHVGANTAVALSPQFAVDRATVPFETRWRREARQVRFPAVGSRPAPMQYIFYDPHHRLDSLHVARFRDHGPVREMKIAFGGHPAGTVLAQCGLLGPAVLDCFTNQLDIATLAARWRHGRRQSSQYLWTLASALPDRRLPTALRLARMAVAAQRTDHSLRHLANLLVRDGRAEEAVALLREAMAVPQADIHVGLDLARLLEQRYRLGEAAAVLAFLQRRYPASSLIRDRRWHLHCRRAGLGAVYDVAKSLWLRRS